MQEQSTISSLRSNLAKNSSVIHKKSLTIIQTVLKTIHQQIANQSEANTNLIVLTLLYKHFKQSVEAQSIENSISYLLLINHLLPHVNSESLQKAGVLSSIKDLTENVLRGSNKNLLGLRYCISVLTELVLVSRIQQTQYNASIVSILLQLVLKSNKNIERKQASKNLRLILDKYPTFGSQLASQTKRIIQQNTSSNIFIHSIKGIVGFFPAILLNDICYLLRPYLKVEDELYNQQFCAEIYFFLDAVMEMQLITGDISEEILKELIHNIPLGGNPKITHGYLQCIHSSFLTLSRVNPNLCQRYLPSTVSVVSEMLLTTGKVPRQAEGILKQVINQGVNQSLWIKQQDQFDLGNLQIEGESNSLKKLVSMIQDLLSKRYDDRRLAVFGILKEFFGRIDSSALTFVEPLIQEVVKERQRFQVGEFNELFGTIIQALGQQTIFHLFPLSLRGDPTEQEFQLNNNLWLLQILSKNAPAGSFQLFIDYIYPLLKVSQNLRINPEQNKLRQQIYNQISHRFWMTLSNLYLPQRVLKGWEECIQYIQENLQDKYNQLHLVLNGFIQLLTHSAVNPKYFSDKSQSLIKILAKMLDLSNQKQSRNILISISNLAKVCPAEYLDRVFMKNLMKLYTQAQQGTLLQNEATNSKNLQILMAMSHGVNFQSHLVYESKYIEKTTQQQVTQRLSKYEWVHELIQKLLQEKNIFQKKAFKYLLQCFVFMPQNFIFQVKDLIQKQVQILPSSRSYRLAVLHAFWNNSGFSSEECNIENALVFIKDYLPEIILMLKQPNQKVRKLSVGLLNKILQTMNNFGIIQSFLETMSAGLASVSASGKVDTINALTLSLGSLDTTTNSEFAQQLTDVILVLLQESNPEILKAVINYLRKYIFLFPTSKNNLPQIMKAIFKTDQNISSHVLFLVKRLLLKLVKRDSKDSIMKIIPTEHQRLLKSLMKEQGKKKRQQRRKQLNRKADKKNKNDDESEDEDRAHHQERNQMEVQENEESIKKSKNNLLLKYDLDEQRFHFVDGKKKQSKSVKKTREENQLDDIAFIDGKLIVKQGSGKRKRPESTIEEQEDDETDKVRAPVRVNKVKDANALHQIKQSGSSYKAARAQGDLRVKNKPQPHAFIQLNPKALNKRYKQKADKVFDNFFQKKEGGLKGLKARMLKKK